MKILIVSVFRSGSTSLSLNLGKILNYEIYHEPFNYTLNEKKISYPIKIKDNKIFRTITYQVPKEFGNPNNFIKFIVEFKNQFDKIILLSRRNKKEHLESYVNLIVKTKLKKSVYEKWNINEIKDELKHFKYEEIQPHIDAINKLSELIDVPITYYEDLYGKNRIKSKQEIEKWDLNIDANLLNNLLHPKFKQRDKRINLI